MQDVKRVLNLIATRWRIKQFDFFNWLSNVKNLVLFKIAFFLKKFQKIAQQLGALPPNPRL